MFSSRIVTRVLLAGLIFSACTGNREEAPDDSYKPKPYSSVRHPEWTKRATIYEVNIRQFTPEGTFDAFQAHLPRLKAMGVDIIWLMPIHPIGKKGRKGSLGSPYSVQDYYGINPEFGDEASFRRLVRAIHDQGMYVILDWVANHSARDNALAREHPDWYLKGRDSNFVSTPWRDYDDIMDFDYSQPGLRAYMTKAMTYWVRNMYVDGFRCDVASFVPLDFWEQVRKELNAIRPIFLLAEAADRDLHQHAFDMTYSWALWDALHRITTQGASIEMLTGGYVAEHVSIWPRDAYRMNFVDNHDKNAWEGTAYQNFGAGLQAAIVLTATMEGMPMMYSGQESGLSRALPFFEKDTIRWQADTLGGLYTKLFQLKHEHPSLWNGNWGGPMVRLTSSNPRQLMAFVREKDSDKVITLVNLSAQPIEAKVNTRFDRGSYQALFSGKTMSLADESTFSLSAWGYEVLVRQP